MDNTMSHLVSAQASAVLTLAPLAASWRPLSVGISVFCAPSSPLLYGAEDNQSLAIKFDFKWVAAVRCKLLPGSVLCVSFYNQTSGLFLLLKKG